MRKVLTQLIRAAIVLGIVSLVVFAFGQSGMDFARDWRDTTQIQGRADVIAQELSRAERLPAGPGRRAVLAEAISERRDLMAEHRLLSAFIRVPSESDLIDAYTRDPGYLSVVAPSSVAPLLPDFLTMDDLRRLRTCPACEYLDHPIRFASGVQIGLRGVAHRLSYNDWDEFNGPSITSSNTIVEGVSPAELDDYYPADLTNSEVLHLALIDLFYQLEPSGGQIAVLESMLSEREVSQWVAQLDGVAETIDQNLLELLGYQAEPTWSPHNRAILLRQEFILERIDGQWERNFRRQDVYGQCDRAEASCLLEVPSPNTLRWWYSEWETFDFDRDFDTTLCPNQPVYMCMTIGLSSETRARSFRRDGVDRAESARRIAGHMAGVLWRLEQRGNLSPQRRDFVEFILGQSIEAFHAERIELEIQSIELTPHRRSILELLHKLRILGAAVVGNPSASVMSLVVEPWNNHPFAIESQIASHEARDSLQYFSLPTPPVEFTPWLRCYDPARDHRRGLRCVGDRLLAIRNS